MFAVENGGTILHYDGNQWNTTNITLPGLRGVWGSSSTDVFAIGGYGVLHYDGNQWKPMEGIWGNSSNDEFTVEGDCNNAFHYDGNQWTMIKGIMGGFYSIWGTSNRDVFAVGNSGTLFHYDGNQWTMISNTVYYFSNVWGTSSTNVFTVGPCGKIFHYDGTQLNPMTNGTTADLGGIWSSSNTDVFAIGWDGTILHYDGNQWNPMVSGTDSLYSIWGSSGTNVFVVGGKIIHYDGNQWNTMISGIELEGIWGASSTDVFAVGLYGTILHYDGNQWNPMTSGTSAELRGIWGSSSTDVFAVGEGDIFSGEYTLLHYDGNNWTANTKVPLSLYAIWGSPEGDIFAAGDRGIIRCANCQQPAKKFYCCNYTDSNGTHFCDASLDSYSFEECQELAKNAGAIQFKWGQVDQSAAEMCQAGGMCGEVQEYLPATLDNLTVSTLDNQPIIQWDTASELNNLGMNLWCAQLAKDHFKNITQLNSELIPTKAILPQLGAFYSSADYPTINSHLKPGIQHCTLEDVDAGGQCTLHCDHIKTVVLGDKKNITNAKLNELNTKAITLCHESQLAGMCLARRLTLN
ncbi:MAG: hypothetical protein HC877_20585 [Thioploca sp.]|nr:hypothetical protein [Thioploca sp.]